MSSEFRNKKIPSVFESLEDRVLFDGVPDAELIPAQTDVNDAPPVVAHVADQAVQSVQRELILLDSGVENSDDLMLSLLENTPEKVFEIHVIESDKDGVAQISDWLSNSEVKYDAIHIVSHGSQGEVHLGSSVLSNDNVNEYLSPLAQWGASLTENADLLFYGCDLAGNEAGLDLVKTISAVTGADVAASSDLTGHRSLGGDWDLEVKSGQIETAVFVTQAGQDNFRGTLVATPTATITAPSEVMLGESFGFSVSFDNLGNAGDVGYQPFLDILLPSQGAEDTGEGISLFFDDNGTPSTSDDTPGLSFLGQLDALEYDLLTFDEFGELDHPLTGETILGTPGDTLVVVQPHVGSFAPGQPELTIDLNGLLDSFANLTESLEIKARAGFDFGTSPTDNGNILSDGADSSVWTSTATVTPTLFEVSKSYLGSEDETVTGPNHPQQYQIDVNIADGQTLTDLDITDYLPNNARFLQIVSMTSTDSSTVFSTTEPVYTLDPVTNQLTYPDPHELVVNANTVTGEAGDTPEISIVFEYYIAEFDSEGDRVIPDDNGSSTSSGDGEDDLVPGSYPDHVSGPLLDLESTSPNDVDALGDWDPLDPDDAGGIDNAYAEPVDGAPDHILDNKSLAIQKSVELITDNNSTGYSPGDVVRYTLSFQISDYYTFGDLAIYDILGDGLLFDQTFDPTFDISDRNGSFNGTFNWSVSSDILNQQTQGAADLLSLPSGNLLVDESRVDRTDDGSEDPVSDGTSHLIFNLEQVLLDAGRSNGVLQGGVVLTDAELRPGDGDATGDEHDDAPLAPAIGTITFQAVIQQEFADTFPSGDRSVDHGDVLTNDVDIYGTVRDNIDTSIVTHREDDDSGANIETVFGEIDKTIFAINGDTSLGSSSGINPNELIVGDTITYSIEYTLPNSNFEDLQIHDFMPFPVLDVSDPNADGITGPSWYFDSSAPGGTPPAMGVISIGANDTFFDVEDSGGVRVGQSHYENNVSASVDTDQNRLTIDFGDFDTDAEVASTIHLLLTVRINDEEFDPGLYLTNTTRVTEASTNGSNNVVDDLVLIQMDSPNLQIRKGVVGANSPNAVFSSNVGPSGVTFAPPGTGGSPFSGTISHSGLNSNHINADISGVRPGDTVRFAIVLRNWDSRATMFDVRFNDTLPTGLDYIANSLQVVDGTGATINFTDLDGEVDGSGLFGTGIELIDPGPTDAGIPDFLGQRGAIDGTSSGDGRSVAIAFYDVVVTDAVGTQEDFDNSASLYHGASSEGGSDIVGTQTDNATVSRHRVDLEVDKQVSNATPNIGDVVTWTISVTNNATNATTSATGVVIDDAIPSGQNVVVGSAVDSTGGTFDYFTGEWTLGAGVAPGATATLTFDAIVGIGAEYTTDQVDLELDVNVDNLTPEASDTVNVSVSLTNSSEGATTSATGVTVGGLDEVANISFVSSSDVASHGTFDSSTGIWDLSSVSIGAGQTVTLQYQITIDGGTADGTIIGFAPEVRTVVETDIDSTAGNSSTSEDDDSAVSLTVVTNPVPPAADLSSRLWVDSNQDGVQDDGEATLAGVTLELWDHSLATPALVTTTTTNGSGVYSFLGLTGSNDYQIRITESEFQAGGLLESYRITKQHQQTLALAETNQAVSGAAALDRTNDGVNETAADQTIDVLTANGLPTDGYQVVITNMTGGIARLDDDQQVVFQFEDHSTSGSFDYMIFDHRLDNDAFGYDDDGDGMTDRAIVSFTTGSAGGAVDQSLDFGLIEEFVDLELEKLAERRVVLGGEEAIFTITLTNNADFLGATGVTVSDSLPAGLTYVAGSAVASQGSFDGSTWTLSGTIDAGETVTLTYRALVGNGIEGSVLKNGAQVATVDQLDVDSQAANDDGDFSQDDEDDSVVLVGTRTATTIINSAQVVAQDQEDFDSQQANDDHDQSEDDEDSASFTVSSPGTIGNTVWIDEDSNGLVDAGEPGIANVLVQLKNSAGVVIATTRTDANGNYLFTDLTPDTYFVDIDESTLPPGMTQTTLIPVAGGDQSNQDHTGNGYSIVLGSGDNNMTGDFGYNYNPTDDVNNNTGTATLGDRIWADTDGDGVQGPGEVGVGGVTVNLYTDPDGDGVYDTLAGTTVTDALGNYIFDGLAAGAYVVSVDSTTGSPVDGWTQTGDPEDWGMVASNPDNQSSPIVLAAGDVNLDIDFGYQPGSGDTGSIGSTIWFDLDNSSDDESNIGSEPGLAGVTVSLIQDLNGNGVWDPATELIIATDVTDENGQYLFTGLSLDDGDGDADYIVWVNDTAGIVSDYEPSYDADGTGTPDVSATALNSASPNDLDQDFSYVNATTGTTSGGIGDTIFLDRNGDGSADAGEGIEGVEVLIYDSDGRLVSAVFTDQNGKYYFDSLDPTGTYRVEVNTATLPPGLTNSVDPNGGLDNRSVYDLSTEVTGINIDQDFGYVPSGTAGSIGSLVWVDTNADGTADGADGPDGIAGNDDDEPGIAGVTIDLYIDNNNDGVLNAGDTIMGTTVTDSNGEYLFSNLPVEDSGGTPINYIVDVSDRDAVLNGYVHSLGTQAQADDNESKTDGYAIQLTDAEPDVLTADFGYFNENASIGNFVWVDLDLDGIQDPGDYGVNGVPVTLTIDSGSGSPIVVTVLTQTGPNGKDGWYSFDHLLADEDLDGSEATYTISVGTHLNSANHYGLFPTLVDQDSGGSAPDQEDSDDHDGVVASPSRGFTNVDDEADPNDEGSIGSFDFGFLPTDHGDLPESFNTSNANLGPVHVIDNVTFLGASVDSEVDGQSNSDATGDGADEDGVVFLNPLMPGTTAQIRVNASVAGYLNAWIDFNSDGVFGAGEQIALDELLSPGDNIITVNVPADATGTMAARFRFTNDDPGGTLSSTGVWENGEVEDYMLGSIGDRVWLDDGSGGGNNNDGIQDGGEVGVSGVTVNLLNAAGEAILDALGNPISTTTGLNGEYEFSGLPPGDYKVEFIEPDGYVFVDANVGGDDSLDSDANQSTGVTDQVYNIGANSLNQSVDAGLVLADYGDLTDGYGTLDATGGAAHGLDGSTFLGSGVDADADGQPNSNATGDDSDGNDDEDGVTFLGPLTAGNSARIQIAPSVDGYLNAWIDFDSDGTLDEVTVTHIDGVLQGSPIQINDLFLMGGTNPILTISVPPEATGTMAARFRFSNDAMGVDRSTTGNWDNGEVEDYVLGVIGDFVFEDNGAGVGGESGDGIQNGSEAGIAGITVYLLDSGGTRINDPVTGNPISTVTDSDGSYEFAGLPPNDYRVEFAEPTGFDFTDQNAGSDDDEDSDAAVGTGISDIVTISPGVYDDSVDAGLVEYDYGDLEDSYGTSDGSALGPARHVVDDVTFLGSTIDSEDDGQPTNDATGDGADEDGIVFLNPLMPGLTANIRVTASVDGYLNAWIDFDGDGTLDEITVTHVNGVEQLTPLTINDLDLMAGDTLLTIRVPINADGNMPSRFRFTEDEMGVSRSANGDWDNGEVEDYVLGTIGDRVWIDNGSGGGTIHDGIQDSGEVGLAGVTVYLLNGSGARVQDADGNDISVVTDSNGDYEFVGLPQGDYRIEFEEPDGYVFTDAEQGSDDAIDSDANQETGISDQTYTIGANSINLSVDAGVVELDFGDLPDIYGTSISNNGAAHGIDGSTYLGSGVDSELDGQPNADASGDGSDEDGVTFLTPLTAGNSATIRVEPNVHGYLNAWIDFDSDGVLDEVTVTHVDGVALPSAVTIADLELTAGPHTLTFDVPTTATGTMAARFRFSEDVMGASRSSTGNWANGEVEDYVLGAIGNVVFEDNGAGVGGESGDGIQNGTEPGVEGVTVYLLNGAGVRINDPVTGLPISTMTDVDGNYEFAGLPPGSYRVEFVEPTGFDFTDQNVGSDDGADSDADLSTGVSDTTTLVAGQYDDSIDAGIVEYDYGDLDDSYGTSDGSGLGPARHVVDDVTFLGSGIDSEDDGQPTNDASGDGSDEDGIVFLNPLMPNGVADIQVTASVDGYLNAWIDFDGDGTLDEVSVTHVNGTALPSPVNIDDLSLDAGVTTLTIGVPSNATGNMPSRFRFSEDMMASSRSANGDWDNGEVEDYVLGSIGDIVWLDNGSGGGVGNDGIQNGSEPGIQNVVVHLLDSNGEPVRDSNGDPVTTLTDGSGNYEFSGLPTGAYKVSFDLPTGYQFSDTDQGSDDGLDSDANELTGVTDQTYTVVANTTITNVDAGMMEQDFGDLPDVYGTSTAAGGASHGLDGATFLGTGVDSESDGQPNDDASGDGADEDGVVFLTPLMPGTNANIQVVPSVDGYLNAWIDFDSDGVLDEATVTHVDGVALPTPTTISDLFLTGGTHTLTIEVPDDATGAMAARFRFSDDAMGTERSTTGEWDNGEVEDYVLASIGDIVWLDNGAGGGTGADGIQNGSEAGVANVVVNLLNGSGVAIRDADGNPITTMTDSNGNYEFPGLPTGNYQVEFVLPTGMQFTDTDQGADDSRDSDANETTGITQSYSVVANTVLTHVDAGIQEQDFGDLPDTYNTTSGVGGPVHGLDGATYLGTTVDAELDGQPSTDSTGDGADEDGVVFVNPIVAGTTAEIEVTASVDGYLNAWIDFNGNGVFEAGEQIATDQPVTAGVNTLTVNVPADATGVMGARFRLTSDDPSGALTSDGAWDNGEVEDYILSTIGNYVWYDDGSGGGTPGDGIQDPGETPMENVVVYLLDGNGDRLLDSTGTEISTTTDGSGFYEFAGLPPGDYSIEVVPPVGFGITNQNVGSDDGVDSDVNQITYKSNVVTIGLAENNDSVDIGLARFDYGDLPASYGATLFADDGARHVVDNVTFLGTSVDIDAEGFPSNDGLGDDSDNSADGDGIAFLNPLMAGSPADIQVSASVDGYLNAWIDFNSDGVLDEIMVTHVDGVELPAPTTINDLFLTGGDHTITIDVPSDATGTMAARFRFTNDEMGAERSSIGQWNNGEVEDYVLGSLSNRVFYDTGTGTQGDGIQNTGEASVPGITVYLLDGSGNRIQDAFGNDVVTVTNSEGEYEFAGLAAGDYKVEFELPDNHFFTLADQGAGDGVDSDANFDTGITDQTYTINPGNRNYTADAGILPDSSLGDRVWFDINGDGIQDAGEPGMAGLDVQIDVDINGDGTTDYTETVTTDANGDYLFDSLPPGSVMVTLLNPPNGFTGTFSADGGEWRDYLGNLGLDEDQTQVDFGLTGTGSLSGTVHEDGLDDDDSPLLMDGIQDPIEPGIPGVTITLQGVTNTGITFERTTVTDSDGNYTFDNLPPGTYTLIETQPNSTPIVADSSGYLDGIDTVGSLGGSVPGDTLQSDVISNIVLGDNEDGVDYDFSEIPEADPNGFVFVDENNNGVMDPGEPGIPGVVITLEGTDVFGNSVVETTLTDENGFYFFDELNAGTYRLIETQPTGYDDGLEQNGTPPAIVGDDSFSGINLGWGDLHEGFNFGERDQGASGNPPFFAPFAPLPPGLTSGLGSGLSNLLVAPPVSSFGSSVFTNANPLSLESTRPITGGYSSSGQDESCGCGTVDVCAEPVEYCDDSIQSIPDPCEYGPVNVEETVPCANVDAPGRSEAWNSIDCGVGEPHWDQSEHEEEQTWEGDSSQLNSHSSSNEDREDRIDPAVVEYKPSFLHRFYSWLTH